MNCTRTGRLDIALIPKPHKISGHHKDLGLILEFKHAKPQQNTEKLADKALEQIDTHNYATFLKQNDNVVRVLKIGVCFLDKSVTTVFRMDDMDNHPLSEIQSQYSQLSFDSDEEEQNKKGKKRRCDSSSTDERAKKKLRTAKTSLPLFFSQNSDNSPQSSQEEDAHQLSPSF